MRRVGRMNRKKVESHRWRNHSLKFRRFLMDWGSIGTCLGYWCPAHSDRSLTQLSHLEPELGVNHRKYNSIKLKPITNNLRDVPVRVEYDSMEYVKDMILWNMLRI